jgi:hypothetical protein
MFDAISILASYDAIETIAIESLGNGQYLAFWFHNKQYNSGIVDTGSGEISHVVYATDLDAFRQRADSLAYLNLIS